MNNIDLKVIGENELGNNRPCIVKFPNGLPPQNFIESSPEFQSYTKKLNNNKKSRVILSAADSLEYESNTLSTVMDTDLKESFYPPSESSKYAMAIFDKDTNQLVILPSELHDLKQSVIGYRLTLEKSFNTLSREERRVEIKKLATDFGSKITKKKIQKMEMEDVDNLDYDKTNKNVIKNQNILADKQSEEAPLDLPAFNREANKEIDAYPIEEIFPPKVYFRLDAEPFIDIVHGKSKFDSTKYPAYFKVILDSMMNTDTVINKDDIEHTCKILSFMYYTIIMLQKKSISALDTAGCQLDVKSYLTSNFSNKISQRERIVFVDENYNKIYNYLVILSLHLEGFIARNVSLLAQALSMTAPQLEKHYFRVGCKIFKRTGDIKSYSLVVPLKFPDSSKRKFGK